MLCFCKYRMTIQTASDFAAVHCELRKSVYVEKIAVLFLEIIKNDYLCVTIDVPSLGGKRLSGTQRKE